MSLIDLGTDILIEIATYLDRLTDYLKYLSLCKTIQSVDSVLHNKKRSELLIIEKSNMDIGNKEYKYNVYTYYLSKTDEQIITGEYHSYSHFVGKYNAINVVIYDKAEFVNGYRYGMNLMIDLSKPMYFMSEDDMENNITPPIIIVDWLNDVTNMGAIIDYTNWIRSIKHGPIFKSHGEYGNMKKRGYYHYGMKHGLFTRIQSYPDIHRIKEKYYIHGKGVEYDEYRDYLIGTSSYD